MRSLVTWVGLLATLLWGIGPAVAAPRYDVLIVANQSNPTSRATAHELRRALEKARADMGLTSQDLPVDEYDIGQPSHKVAVDRLGISKSQLVFVGVCSLGGASSKPVKVLRSVGPVTDVASAVELVMADAGQRMGLSPPASSDDPADAARTFFAALAKNQDRAAWNLLSETSKQQMAAAVAKAGNTSAEQVRALLDGGNGEVLKALWDSFRQDASAISNKATFRTVDAAGDAASVSVQIPGENAVAFRMSKEAGAWKVGLMETAAAKNGPPKTIESPLEPEVPAAGAPAAAFKSFLQALDSKDYQTAWELFSERTRRELVTALAGPMGKTEAEVRKLFDRNDPQLVEFWDGFRNSAHADVLLQRAKLTVKSTQGSRASVEVSSPSGAPVTVLMFNESSGWRVGWMESFFPNGFKP